MMSDAGIRMTGGVAITRPAGATELQPDCDVYEEAIESSISRGSPEAIVISCAALRTANILPALSERFQFPSLRAIRRLQRRSGGCSPDQSHSDIARKGRSSDEPRKGTWLMDSANSVALAAAGQEKMVRSLFDELRNNTTEGRGIRRDAYGGGENFAHQLLAETAKSLGLEVERDAAANTYMTLEGRDRSAPRVLVGSHLRFRPERRKFRRRRRGDFWSCSVGRAQVHRGAT